MGNLRLPIVAALGVGFFFASADDVQAQNRINSMDVSVEIQGDGSAVVTERRVMELEEGSEVYIVMDNLGDVEITDFRVEGFEFVEDWDSDRSIEEKAGTYGTLDTGDSLELIWGMGEYGTQDFELTYTLQNVVQQLEDGQSLYWNFDTFSPLEVADFALRVSGPVPFTDERVRFQAFGFEGNVNLEGGDLVWTATEDIHSEGYASVQLQFLDQVTTTSNHSDLTLDEQWLEAQDSTGVEQVTENENDGAIVAIIALIAGGGLAATIGGVGIYSHIKKKKQEAGEIPLAKELYLRNEGKESNHVPYPTHQATDIAYLLNRLQGTTFDDYFFESMIQWEMDGRTVSETDEETGEVEVVRIVDWDEEMSDYLPSFKDYVKEFDFERDRYEDGLWLLFQLAANHKGEVTPQRLEKYSEKNGHEISKFSNLLNDYSLYQLASKGYVVEDSVRIFGKDHSIDKLTRKGDELVDSIVQFENYIVHHAEEGSILELDIPYADIMIWGTLLGLSDTVDEEVMSWIDSDTTGTFQSPVLWYWWYSQTMYSHWDDGYSTSGYGPNASSFSSGNSVTTSSFGGGMSAGGGGGGGTR